MTKSYKYIFTVKKKKLDKTNIFNPLLHWWIDIIGKKKRQMVRSFQQAKTIFKKGR